MTSLRRMGSGFGVRVETACLRAQTVDGEVQAVQTPGTEGLRGAGEDCVFEVGGGRWGGAGGGGGGGEVALVEPEGVAAAWVAGEVSFHYDAGGVGQGGLD